MWLTQKTQISFFLLIVLVLFVSSKVYGFDKETCISNKNAKEYALLVLHKRQYFDKTYALGVKPYSETVNDQNIDSIFLFKKLAFSYAKANKEDLACMYIEKYIKSSLDVSFIEHNAFDWISSSDSYHKLADKYYKKLNIWWILCMYVGFVGVFISVVLNFRKRSDKIANFLMSMFLFQHSVFIINIGLLPTNYEFYFPHSLYLSTLFSFLYGPLIYFYFKRVTINYKFKLIDILHLIPTFLLIFLLFPVYNLPGEEKLWIMLNDERPYITLISDTKLLSLLVYMVLVIRIYIKPIQSKTLVSKMHHIWQRNVIILCSLHIISYVIYDTLMIRRITSDFPMYFQIISIALLVLYICYKAFVQPGIFGSLAIIKKGVHDELGKYKNSGLTDMLSLELKDRLLDLMNKEKIYRKNDINLQKLSEFLGTTRHNTSQVINEHFDLNFFELINRYRIEEAKELLKMDKHKKVNIIDVAYEVGFNNKVTFNKSFKKYNKITPSEYVKS
ncbi:helix-turn-helix domain-containing protein [Aquimarina sediminis]|uniref:helix-turn-helix domain-containing protein n=1 Tax=Aquimarina sediminis TaxID=2070536 RepID=UPI000CA05C20|nr:helix-turn-helix domain-containing protein [Aquimarina sediminis]